MRHRLNHILSLLTHSRWQKSRNILVLSFGVLFIGVSIYTISNMVSTMRQKELYDVELWVRAMEQASVGVSAGDLPHRLDIANARQNIPFIVMDDEMNVVLSHLVDERALNHPDQLRRLLRDFTAENRPIEFRSIWRGDKSYYLVYGTSQLLRQLSYIPYTQYCLLVVFFLIAYIALRSTKQGEQDRVWVGLAKETAHQLGTPISSLMGWVEYLREQNVESEAVAEMDRDLTHLLKVTDRFSKIGADTPLVPAMINEVVEDVVRYFRGRIPRGVTLNYDGLTMSPSAANINTTLFEWVIENLLKNSLDALQGSGNITVDLVATEQDIIIDVKDTGKGISKGAWRKIFEPGYTTKSRGWGLGLSLSRRIIEDYHKGRIWVISSEAGVGTTIRILLKRSFDI